MAVNAKAVTLIGTQNNVNSTNVANAGTPTTGTINVQPASGKMWWFKALRYALGMTLGGNSAQIHVYLKEAGTVAITLKDWWMTSAGGLVAGSPPLGGQFDDVGVVATNDQYIQIEYYVFAASTFNGAGTITSILNYAFRWFGIEVDI